MIGKSILSSSNKTQEANVDVVLGAGDLSLLVENTSVEQLGLVRNVIILKDSTTIIGDAASEDGLQKQAIGKVQPVLHFILEDKVVLKGLIKGIENWIVSSTGNEEPEFRWNQNERSLCRKERNNISRTVTVVRKTDCLLPGFMILRCTRTCIGWIGTL
ncbi:hypothetical protein ACFX19_034936 [Malus domestica]